MLSQRINTRRIVLAVSLMLSLGLAGCASLGGQGQQPSATARPTTAPTPGAIATPLTIPALQTISLNGYHASLALPGAAGLALDPAAPSNGGGMPSLSFYSYSTQQVETIATAPTESDGSVGGIRGSAYGGDWVSYVVEDQQQSNWALMAYNVSTGERIQVDSEASEGITAPWTGAWLSTANDLVWATYNPNGGGQAQAKLLDFSYTTRQTQTLLTSSTLLIHPLAMTDSAILLQEADNSGNAPTYLLDRGASGPQQISTQIAGNAWMSSNYAVWDNAHAQTTTLYNLRTNTETQNWANCIRPAVADPQPYVVCIQFANSANVLVHIPDGNTAAFDVGNAELGAGGQIYNGRAFWVTQSGDVEYFDLPPS